MMKQEDIKMKKRTADSILRYIREENVSGIPPETVYAGWNLNFGYPPDTPEEYLECLSMIANLQKAKEKMPSELFSCCAGTALGVRCGT